MQISNKFFNSPLWIFSYWRLSSATKISVHTCISEFIIWWTLQKGVWQEHLQECYTFNQTWHKTFNFLKGIIHALIKIYPLFSLHHKSQVHVTKRLTIQYTSLLLGYSKIRKYIIVHIKAINLCQLHLFNIESINRWFGVNIILTVRINYFIRRRLHCSLHTCWFAYMVLTKILITK